MPITPDTEALMLAYVYGELSESAARAFEEQLAKDAELRAEVDGLMATRDLLDLDVRYGEGAGLDEPPPHLFDAIVRAEALTRAPELREAAVARVAPVEAGPTWVHRLSTWLFGGGLAVAGAAALALFVTWSARDEAPASMALEAPEPQMAAKIDAPEEEAPAAEGAEADDGLGRRRLGKDSASSAGSALRDEGASALGDEEKPSAREPEGGGGAYKMPASPEAKAERLDDSRAAASADKLSDRFAEKEIAFDRQDAPAEPSADPAVPESVRQTGSAAPPAKSAPRPDLDPPKAIVAESRRGGASRDEPGFGLGAASAAAPADRELDEDSAYARPAESTSNEAADYDDEAPARSGKKAKRQSRAELARKPAREPSSFGPPSPPPSSSPPSFPDDISQSRRRVKKAEAERMRGEDKKALEEKVKAKRAVENMRAESSLQAGAKAATPIDALEAYREAYAFARTPDQKHTAVLGQMAALRDLGRHQEVLVTFKLLKKDGPSTTPAIEAFRIAARSAEHLGRTTEARSIWTALVKTSARTEALENLDRLGGGGASTKAKASRSKADTSRKE